MSEDERKSISDEIRSLRNLIISVLVTVILSAAGVIVSGVIFVYNLRDSAVDRAVAITDSEVKHSDRRATAQFKHTEGRVDNLAALVTAQSKHTDARIDNLATLISAQSKHTDAGIDNLANSVNNLTNETIANRETMSEEMQKLAKLAHGTAASVNIHLSGHDALVKNSETSENERRISEN